MKYLSPKIHRTPEYRAKAAYANMKRRCLNACGTEASYKNVELRITKEEWLKWAEGADVKKVPHTEKNG